MTGLMVAGRPVTGDINRYTQRTNVEQWPIERFVTELDHLLALPGVAAIRWEQYTPYFNDGDPCLFSVDEAEVSLTERSARDDDDEGDYDDADSDFVQTYSMYDYDATDTKQVRAQFALIFPALQELNGNLEHYEDALNDAFGDPAEVTATSEGFSVEFYDHD